MRNYKKFNPYIYPIVICIILAALLHTVYMPLSYAYTRSEVRQMYRDSSQNSSVIFEDNPSSSPEYVAGSLSSESQMSALQYLNFIRWLAGLDSNVKTNDLYSMRAQHGAVLLAAIGKLSHTPEMPVDMNSDFYQTAYSGTSKSNLACFNWFSQDVLIDAIDYWVRDEGADNLSVLGHRRWLLNPAMAFTGFGLATSDEGLSYCVMYAVDMENESAKWDSVCWPAAGAFPSEFLTNSTAWSISLNPQIYDLGNSDPVLTLTETGSGVQYIFDDFSGETDIGYAHISDEEYGAGPCIIFRPNLDLYNLEAYEQNQIWNVSLDGLRLLDGSESSISYQVELMSLHYIDPVSVELSKSSIVMEIGDVFSLSGQVIPYYADNTSLTWSSDNVEVAKVDSSGNVTALSTGICTVTATAENGRYATCEITINGSSSN